MGILLGLMCKYSCEESELLLYGNNGYQPAELEKGTILDNMDRVLKIQPVCFATYLSETDFIFRNLLAVKYFDVLFCHYLACEYRRR